MPDTVKTLQLEIVLDETGAVKGVKGIGKATKGLKKEVEKSSKGMASFTQTIKKNWLAIGATIASAFILIKKAFDLSRQFLEYKQGMDALSRNTGQNADAIVKKLAEVTKGTVANKDVMLAANRLVALNVTRDTDKMAKLFEIARVKAKAMGISTSQAISDISTGIGRASPLILDNLGIITKGWDKEAKAAGQAMDAQFILNKVLADGQKELERTGATLVTGAERMQQMEAAASNFKVALGFFISDGLAPVVEWISKVLKALGNMMTDFANASKRMNQMKTALKDFGDLSSKQVRAVEDLADAFEKWEDAQKTVEEFLKTRDELVKQGRDFQDEINNNIDGAGKFASIWNNAKEVMRESGEEMSRLKKILDGTNIATGKDAVEAVKAMRAQLELWNQEVEESNVPGPDKKKIEEDKRNIEDFYSFIGDQRELDLIKERESFERAKEGLQRALEERKIARQEFNLAMQDLEELHQLKIKEIDMLANEERLMLNEVAMQEFGIQFEELTIKHQQEVEKMADNQKALADDIRFAMNTAVGNVVSTYADGIANMIVEGEIFRKTWKDLLQDLIKEAAKLVIKLLTIKGLQAALTGGVGLIFARGGRVPKRYDIGGSVVGGSHSEGGVNINAEGGEFMVRKSKVTPDTLPILHAINNGVNNLAGLIPISRQRFQEGGPVTNDNRQTSTQLFQIDNVNIEDPDPDKIFNAVVDKAEDTGVDLLEGK